MLILLIIAFALLGAGLLFLPKLAQPKTSGSGVNPNEVSIIIPARNEEHNLPRLLESITSQPVQPLEIIVVDDYSDDRTAELAQTSGAKVISSKQLPNDWRGKTWACHQGAQKAEGQYLLFLDADTWFETGGLQKALDHYQDGALSICPWHYTSALYESLSLFFNLAMVVGTTPRGLFGQMLLVDRDSYQTAGGHEAVRGMVLENANLAQNFHDNNIPTRSFTGRNILSFRMYPSGVRELIEGWTKGFASGAKKTPASTMVIMVAWMSGLMLVAIAYPTHGNLWSMWDSALILGLIQVFWFSRYIGRFNPLALILFPIPLIFFFALFAWSAIKGGKNVNWKGRQFNAG